MNAWRHAVLATACIVPAFAIRACERDSVESAPALAWDGAGYLAAWETLDGDDVLIHTHRFAEARAKPSSSAGRVIVRDHEIRSVAHLVTGGGHALLVYIEGPDPDPDPDEDRSDPPRWLVGAPLDNDGNLAGSPRMLGEHLADASCGAPVWTGEAFVVGYRQHRGRFGVAVQALAFVNSSGVTRADTTVSYDEARWCVLAVSGDALALAFEAWDAPHRDQIAIDLVSATTGKPLGARIWLPERVGSGRYGLIGDDDGWAALYAGLDGIVRVVRFDRNGVRESIVLPRDVDAATMSLGANDRGLFVSWIGGGAAHVRALARGGAHARARAASVSSTRTVGHDDECAVAWLGRGARRVHLMGVERCP